MLNSVVLCAALSIALCLFSSYGFTKEIKIATWNLEWLSSTSNDKFLASKRSDRDFNTLASYFNKLNPDVLAFQEVNDVKAIRRVVGNGYNIFLSDRSTKRYERNQFKDINQYTGIAVRKSITVVDKSYVRLEKSKTSRLRFATYLVLTLPGSKPVHFLSVHLKSGCTGKYYNSHSCITLKREGTALNEWIRQRSRMKQPYIVLGDFNHQLGRSNDWLWNEVKNKISPDPVLATKQTKAECLVRSNKKTNKVYRYRRLIDHIIVSPNLHLGNAHQMPYSKSDVLDYKLSDHCPISIEKVTTISVK